jgi:hypothetical protein
VLGLNLKFIPTPKTTTYDLSQSFQRFQQDMWLKTFWGVEGITAKDIRIEKDNMPKLYMKTGWTPPGAEIPDEVHDRISNFRKALAPLFTKRPGQPNLLPFQQKILRQIRQDDSILIVNVD